MKDFEDFLTEVFVFRVHSNAQKQKKLVCPAGMKPNPGGTTCVPMQAGEKRNRKVGLRKAKITKKAAGPALQKRALVKRRKAMRYRKMMGL